MDDRDRILVVGGLGGIGAGVVQAYPERAVVWSRRTGVDATDPVQVRQAAAELLGEHGAPFAWLHCVGEFEERAVLATDDALYRRLFDSNVSSAFLVARAVVPAMAAAGRGRVVLFAAAGAADATAKPRAPLYFAAKAALVSLARSLAVEVAGRGVTVNVISPGLIRHAESHAESQDRMAPRVPLGRGGTVRDVLGTIRLLLSDEGSYITGADLTVDGGLSL